MDLQLSGKRAVVTGASRGIGLAVARALAAEGARVAMVARGADDLRLAAEGIGTAFVADTADDASVRAMVDAVVSRWGGVDVLVNAAARPAGSIPASGIAGFDEDVLRAEIETKVLGYLRTARAVAPHMSAQGWGRIVNVAGLNARRAGSIPGGIRNVAVSSLTKTLADELGPLGINVTVVHPGTTRTEATPDMVERLADQRATSAAAVERDLAAEVTIGRLVTAAEVADVVAFLCSPRSVAIAGDAVAASGGFRGSVYY